MQFFRFCKPSVPSTPKNDFLPSFRQSHQKISLLYNGHLGADLSTNAAKLFLPPTLNGQIFEKIWGSKCKFSVNSRRWVNHSVQVLYYPLTINGQNFGERPGMRM